MSYVSYVLWPVFALLLGIEREGEKYNTRDTKMIKFNKRRQTNRERVYKAISLLVY
jgi:hypothetical protein